MPNIPEIKVFGDKDQQEEKTLAGEFILKEKKPQTFSKNAEESISPMHEGELIIERKKPYEAEINPNSSSQAVEIPIREQSIEALSDNQEFDKPKHSKLSKTTIKNTAHFFSSFCHHPENAQIKDQDDDEEIILIVRRHFITNLSWIITVFFFSLLPLILSPFISSLLPTLNITGTMKFFILYFYYLALFGFSLVKFSLWYFHVGIVTNKRIVDIDISSMIYRNVAETKIDTIQDVSFTQGGFIKSLFNYGDVHLQTEAINLNFEFDNAPKPNEILRIIGDLIAK